MSSWHAFLFAAQQADMLYAEGQLASLEHRFKRFSSEDRQAAILGIQLRLDTGEYQDAHFVPGMKRYLTERLWTAKLRPRAKTRKDAAMEEFRRRMNEQLADAQGASDVPPTNEEKRANCPLCQGMGWVPVEGENRVEACVCRPDQKKTRRRVSAACLAAPGPSEFDGRYRASSSAGEAEQ